MEESYLRACGHHGRAHRRRLSTAAIINISKRPATKGRVLSRFDLLNDDVSDNVRNSIFAASLSNQWSSSKSGASCPGFFRTRKTSTHVHRAIHTLVRSSRVVNLEPSKQLSKSVPVEGRSGLAVGVYLIRLDLTTTTERFWNECRDQT